MEGESMHNTKVSDSAYSNSCSNSQSRSGSSLKSGQSNSSRSSGYGGGKVQESNAVPQPVSKKKKSKDRKKKKAKNSTELIITIAEKVEQTENLIENEKAVEGESESKNEVENEMTLERKLENLPETTDIIVNRYTDEDIDEYQSENMELETNIESTTKNERGGEEGFISVMSLFDGVILYTTGSITSTLGFPREMLNGRSFVDFMHPKDRATFSNQVTSSVALAETKNATFKDTKSIYVMLRRYRGLKSGYGVKTNSVSYEAFKLSLTFREAPADRFNNVKVQNIYSPPLRNQLLLVISASPMKSVYKVNDENLTLQTETNKFTTRHTAEGILSHVDGTANLLGFFPQDILGRKIFEFYHPEDMHILKEIYDTVMLKGQTGASFLGRPHRFLTLNGSYVEVETEWSSFVNPWQHHLEFVIGNHKILKGPSNPNIFIPADSPLQFPENIMNDYKSISSEILKILSKTIPRPTHSAKQLISKEVLENIMEPLVHDIIKSNSKKDLTLDLPQEPDLTFSERDSVMLGEISPHHDDSKSSSETPPSYNQLNYNETLQRFFDSRPLTTAEEEISKTELNENDVEHCTNLSPANGGGSGDSSAGNMSSASAVNMESMTSTGTSGTETVCSPPVITEALLIKHNEDMEKLIIKRHKVSRTGKNCEKSKKSPDKVNENQNHGVKRSFSHSWIEGDSYKTSKQQHLAETPKSSAQTMTSTTSINMRQTMKSNNNVNLWPPFSVSVTTIQNIHTAASSTQHLTTSNIFPTLYYFPKQILSSQDQRNQPVQYLPGVFYQPMVYQPSFYHFQTGNAGPSTHPSNFSTDTVYNYSNSNSNITMPVLQKNLPPSTSQDNSAFQRPSSQLSTSGKADTDSTPTSLLNRTLSESSKKESIDITRVDHQNASRTAGNGTSEEDESSYSSFYSSFLKTSSSSNDGRAEASSGSLQWGKDRKFPLKRPIPQWLDNFDSPSEEFVYHIEEKSLSDVIVAESRISQSDLNNVSGTLVNDQLGQLYLDLELEGFSTKLSLESTSGSSEAEDEKSLVKTRRKKIKYSKLVLIYEENCPVPNE